MTQKKDNKLSPMIKDIFNILRSDKKGFYLLIIFGLVLSLLEVASVGVFLPILSYFFRTKKEFLDNAFVSEINLINEDNFLNFFLVLLLIFYLLRFFVFIGINVYKVKYLYKINVKLSLKFLQSVFQKSISFRSEKNSSEFITSIGSINSFSQGTLLNIINIFTDALILISLIYFLIIFDAKVTSIIFGLFSFFSYLFYLIYKNKMYTLGKERHIANENKLKNLNEILVGFKEILLSNTKNYFLKKFNTENTNFANASVKEEGIRILPKSFLEVLVIFFLILSILIFNSNDQNLNSIIFKIGVFSIVILKLLPIINRIITSFHNLKNMIFASQRILEIVKEFDAIKENNFSKKKSISFEKLELKNIYFDYNRSQDKKFFFINNINLNIQKKDRLGIIGKSGCGKSTVVDIICGLLQPIDGKILINDLELNQDLLLDWQNIVGYVPQKSIILDSNLVENISFGLDGERADKDRIVEICKLLMINEFIDLTKDLETNKLGESGLKISGGQSQRIGIARALYRNPDILIFDESTNALDLDLENKLLNNIFEKYSSKTFIIISHRKETLIKCNKILKFDVSGIELLIK
jgi:ABC-type bacteriocin/lantibiotic exporter with double-glycine peptidase domain